MLGISTKLEFGSTLKTFLGKKKILVDFAYDFLYSNDQGGRKCFVFLLVSNYLKVHFPNVVTPKSLEKIKNKKWQQRNGPQGKCFRGYPQSFLLMCLYPHVWRRALICTTSTQGVQ